MTTMNKPNTESAATVARVVSRRLRKAGFLMADTSDRYSWTEGFHVSRVGYSNLVNVSYHIPHSSLRLAENAAKRRKAHDEVRRFLEDAGYTLNENGWIVCEGD